MKSRDETPGRKKQILDLETRRTELIKRFLSRQEDSNPITNWISRYITARATQKPVTSLRREVQDYNRKERAQGRRGVAWSRIVDKAKKQRRLERTDRHRLKSL